MDTRGHARLRRRMWALRAHRGPGRLGVQAGWQWHSDPRRLVITLAHYKFIARLLSGRKHVLEVGCGDAFGSRLVLQEVERLTAVDVDEAVIADVRSRFDADWPFDCRVHDILAGPVPGRFDAAYSLDVLPHMPKRLDDAFMGNVCSALTDESILVVSQPTREATRYCSEETRRDHVNCKTAAALRGLMLRYFHTCFLFSANDEIVHTGFYSMAHHLLAVGVGKRARARAASRRGATAG